MATRKTVSKSSAKTPPIYSAISSNLKLKDLILPAIVVIIVILLGVFRGQLVAATVNGEQISRIELLGNLEKRQGKDTLENLITEKLILQEASKRKVVAGANEIKSEVDKIKKSVEGQGQQLDVLLSAQGMTMDDLNKQIKFQVLLKKMVGEIKVTDKEINDYMEQNKEALPESTDEAQLKTQIKQQLEQQKNDEKIQKLISDLKAKAKIEYLLKL